MTEVPEPFDTQQHDSTAKHFRGNLEDEFGFGFSYNWPRAKRRDESTHERAPGRTPHLIRPMDDATNEANPGFLGGKEGKTSGVLGNPETFGHKGFFRPFRVTGNRAAGERRMRAGTSTGTFDAGGADAETARTENTRHLSGRSREREYKGLAFGDAEGIECPHDEVSGSPPDNPGQGNLCAAIMNGAIR